MTEHTPEMIALADAKARRNLSAYPNAPLREPVREFENTMAKMVKKAFAP